MRSVAWILCLYPKGWRQRYEDEMVALLEQHTVTLATIFDLLLGALDARLDPTYRTERALFLFKNERMTATTFLCAYAIFLFAMYNWHHYIPLSLSLTPYYQDIGMVSTQVSSPGLGGVSRDSLLAMSDLVMQVTLLASNLFFIALLVKQAKGARRKSFILPAVLCLVLLLTLPLVPLLGAAASTTLTNTAGTILSMEVSPFDQIVELYLRSIRFLWPLLPLLVSSLFIAIVRIREVMAASRKHWLLLAFMFYLILPVGRMLWLNNSVQIPSNIVPMSAVVLGTMLTYFPPFAGLATMILAIANNEGSKRMWRVALLPASILSLVMLAKLIMTLSILPLILRSVLDPLSSWNDSLVVFTLTPMLLVMFAAGGIVLVALMRGFVAVKTTEPYTQTDTTSPLTQSAHSIQQAVLQDNVTG
ncbi:MAG: hypothetical protein JOZ18_10700 [Chloroflexi bacterium]|nr:hypothetical protein [Chloroflexota bacterium]